MDTTDTLLEPLDADAPCGPNLEYDPAFLALESLAAPRPERAIGDSVKEAEEPDWREVARQAEALAERTRDLRVITPLTAAWLKSGGLPAWAQGMSVIRHLLERYWDDLHPRLDEGDPTERINALAALSASDGMLTYVRLAPVLHVDRVGSFTLRDLRAINGTLKTTDDGTVRADVSPEDIDAVLQNVAPEALVEVNGAVAAALDDIEAIGRMFEERTPGMGPDLDSLRKELRELNGFLQAQLALRVPEADGARMDAVMTDDTTTGLVPGTTEMRAQGRGPIRDTADIGRMLDEMCAWYADNEPSSPVRPLLRRARSLIGLSFGELLRAIAPGGWSEFQTLMGDDGNDDPE